MKTLFTLFFVSVLLSSCVQLNYIGSTYPATQDVDVYVDASAIKKPYVIMGKSVLDNMDNTWLSASGVQKKAVALAAKKGADAVMIGDLDRRYEDGNVQTVTASDGAGKDGVTTTNRTVTSTVSRERTILFLKYQ